MKTQAPLQSATDHQQLLHEMQLLRDYNQALEKENETRNSERIVMQAEIDRLSRLEAQWATRSSSSFSVLSSQEYISLRQEYSEFKIKYDSLFLQNNRLNSKIKSLESNQDPLERDHTKLKESIRIYEARISGLQSRIVSYQSEIKQLKLQYESSLNSLKNSETQLKLKTDQVSRLQREGAAREQHEAALKKEIAMYSSKINLLSEELDRLEKSHRTETVRYTESHQLSNLKAELLISNSKLKEVELKVLSLQQDNLRLQSQLRNANQIRAGASRISPAHQDLALKQLITVLRSQLQQLREFNELVLVQNKELIQQLQQLKPNSHHCPKHRHRHVFKQYSSNKKQQEILHRSKGEETFGRVSGDLINFNNPKGQQKGQAYYSYQAESSLKTNSNIHDRQSDIQRKIQLLQDENQVLKSRLISEL